MDKKITMSLDLIMGDRFSKYSKYIIQERALPDVRDGLKPVQRRILYSMYESGNVYSKPYRKSAKTVGNVIGNYHPHGDSSVYDAMVRMSQDWKYRMPLIDMQGNNGSIDNDPAAAMRYTEARLALLSEQLVRDLDKETVSFALNFDDSDYEPTVFPAAYPNLLVNGATGISAGYATDIPPHNLHEVIDATIHRIQYPNCTLSKIMEFMKGPDFPTGATVEGKEGIYQAFKTGKGKVVIRAKSTIQEEKNHNKIIITEIPYEVNKAELVRKIDEIRFNRSIDGIIEVRDESDRNGLTIVIELNKEISVENTLNYLYKNTDLQKNFNYNMVAIKDKRPILMGVPAILDGYIDHQIDVVTKSTIFDLNKANNRKHIVAGLIKAISILDEVVSTIRASKDKSDAKQNLITKFDFSEKQAEAIVMLQLYRLTNTDIVSLQKEDEQLQNQIAYLTEILDSDDRLRKEIIERLREIKKLFPSPRLSIIKDEVQEVKIDEKAMIISEDINVSITRDGYIKRISNRSIKASESIPFGKKEDDVIVTFTQANTTQHLLLFTSKGNYLFVPLHKVEEFKWKDIGKHVSYLVKVDAGEKIVSTILVSNFKLPLYVVLTTKNGQIKRTELKDFEVTRYSKSIRCMNLKGEDQLVSANLTNDSFGILLVTRNGFAGLYSEQEVSVIGLKAAGIKALNLKDDVIVSARVFDPTKPNTILLVTENVGIKRLKFEDIVPCNRTNKGMMLYKNLKNKSFYVHDTIVCKLQDTIGLLTTKGEQIDVVPSTYSNASIEQKPTSLIKGDVDTMNYVSTNTVQSTDFFTSNVDKSKTTNPVSLTNKKTIVDVPDVPIQKPAKAPKKQETTSKEVHFEKISFEDLLGDGEF